MTMLEQIQENAKLSETVGKAFVAKQQAYEAAAKSKKTSPVKRGIVVFEGEEFYRTSMPTGSSVWS